MEQSGSVAKIAEALSKVQAELKPAPKDSENPFFKSSYADLATVCKTVFPVLTKHGLSVSQIAEGEGSVTTILLHTSGEWIKGTLSLKPTKSDPQGMGSAITYARRYALASICGLATEDEDDDGNAASKPPEKSQGKPEPKKNTKTVDGAIEKIDAAMFVSDCDEILTKAEEYRKAGKLTDLDANFIKTEANKKRKKLEEAQSGS